MVKKAVLLSYPENPWYWTAPAPGIGYIASALENIGIKVKFVDCQITRHYKEKIISLLSEYPVVGLSVNAGNVSSAIDIAGAIRKRSAETKIIMGGPHATAVYEKLIPGYADIVVRGEGEDTIVELMEEEDLSKVKGIAYWDGELKVTTDRPYIEDLDRLKFPAWHLYDLKRYRLGNTLNPLAIIITSRGCPYDCIYCVKNVHGYKVRFRSVDNVIDEVDYLVQKFGVKEIQVMDDIFTSRVEWVKEFCQKLIDRKHKNLRFALSNGIRLDSVDHEMLSLMAQAGFYWICLYWVCVISNIDLESKDKVYKDNFLKRVKYIVDSAQKIGLKVSLFFQLGLINDSIESMEETIDIAKTFSPEGVFFSVAVPFPGTRFYELIEKKGRFTKDLLKESVNCEYGKAVYETDALKAKDIERMFKKAYKEFYFRPAQLWRIFNLKIKDVSTFRNLLISAKKIMFR